MSRSVSEGARWVTADAALIDCNNVFPCCTCLDVHDFVVVVRVWTSATPGVRVELCVRVRVHV